MDKKKAPLLILLLLAVLFVACIIYNQSTGKEADSAPSNLVVDMDGETWEFLDEEDADIWQTPEETPEEDLPLLEVPGDPVEADPL